MGQFEFGAACWRGSFCAVLVIALLLFAGAAQSQDAAVPGDTCAGGDIVAGMQQPNNQAIWRCTSTGATRKWYPQPLYIGSSAATCNSTTAALTRYNAGAIEVCNGTAWVGVGSGASAILGSTATGANPYRSGDVTTGLFSPAVGTVAVATAGTEALRVTATALTVGGNTVISNRYIRTTDPNNLALGGNNGQGLVVGYNNKVAVGDRAVQAASQLEVISSNFTDFRINSGNVSRWTFSTDYGVDPNLKLTRTQGTGNFVFNTGYNVGIGTTSPQAPLDVSGYARLTPQSAQPAACSATNNGALALTSQFTICACKGASTAWVRTTDGTTACTW